MDIKLVVESKDAIDLIEGFNKDGDKYWIPLTFIKIEDEVIKGNVYLVKEEGEGATHFLASELYEDLKEKYIQLKEEHAIAIERVNRLTHKLNKRSADHYPLQLSRKRFNYALRLCERLVSQHAIKNSWNLEEVCRLVGEIKIMKQGPINIEQKETPTKE